MGAKATAVAVRLDLPGIIENILRLLPGTENIAVVIGNSPLEKFWLMELRRELQPFTNRVQFTWFNELSFAGTVEISVRDHGIGLTSDELVKIFQPFYTTKREGLGMGLPISRSITEAHGGRLWAENNADRGATLFLHPDNGRRSIGRHRRRSMRLHAS